MESISLCRDVLSIRYINNIIFLSVGNQLRAFDSSSFKCIGHIDVFPNDVIHGIVKGEEKILVYGGRSLGIFTIKNNQDDKLIIDKIFYHYFDDWIITAEFYSQDNQENLYILFAHNNLYFFNSLTKEFKNIWCEEKCILYGGCLSRENSKELVLLSGTVFQEILLWKVNNEEEYLSDIPVLHRLKGHNGVIFSISYDPEQKLITSTSDDRTIRLWKIKYNDSNKNDLKNSTIDIVTTMFGHTARVWKSIIMKNHVISIGEDSLICIWSLDGTLCNKIIAHGGATIWSIDVSDDESTIFTGGADGAVNSWPFNYGDKLELLPWLSYKNKTPKFVNYLDSGNLIVFIDGGELLCYEPGNLQPKINIFLTRYESYCIMQISPNRKSIAFASKNGDLTIYREIKNNNNEWNLQKIIDQRIVETKIFSLQWLNDEMILLCADRGMLKLIKLVENRRVDVFAEFILPPNKECWTTAAIYVQNILICGDRAGNVFVFNFNKNPQQIFSKIHGRLGVQSFGYLGNKLISTGRDGTLRFYKVHKNPSTCAITLQILHWKKMPIEWGSKIIKTSDNDTFILGFKEIEFMIYSSRLDRLTMRIVCGGGHRSWDCIFNNNIVNFVCIRDKQVNILKNPSCFMSNSILPGFHTKEIHSLSFLSTNSKHKIIMSGSEDCTIRIGTFVENNLNKFDLIPLGTFDGHISNVISIKIVNLDENDGITKNLVFSGGGRAQLFVWEMSVKTKYEKISIEDVTMVELTSFMLHGTDKDRRRTSQNQNQTYFMNPETRFMDISTYTQDLDTIILFVACSDGFVRIFTYKITSNIILLSAEYQPYINRCIIKIHTFLHDNKLILITMATDGKINFWNVNSIINDILLQKNDNCFIENINLIEPFGYLTAHQSGINSYDLKSGKNNNEYYLITGGDDNKLNFNIFKINSSSESNELSIESVTEWNSFNTHTAQITGVKFIDDNRIASVGIDQKFIIHNYIYDYDILKVKLEKNEQFFIADVQGLELNFNNSNKIIACAYGQGLSMIYC